MAHALCSLSTVRVVMKWPGTLAASLLASLLFGPLAAQATPCQLAPQHQNPVTVVPGAFSDLAMAVNKTFIADPDAHRDYDLVAPLDGVTLGFGNWPQQEVRGFFADMKTANGGVAFAALQSCLVDFFNAHPNEWAAFVHAAKLAPGLQSTQPNVAQTIAATLFNDDFMKAYKAHCRSVCRKGEPDFYHDQQSWFLPAMEYALRDRTVIAWQVSYWTRTIITDAVKSAATVGMGNDKDAIVTIAAYQSSSPGWLHVFIDANRGKGPIRVNGHSWNWNEVPPGVNGADALRRWKLFTLWQVYANDVQLTATRKGKPWRVRGRSRSYYDDYLQHWWTLPRLDPHGRPDWSNADNLNPELVRPAA